MFGLFSRSSPKTFDFSVIATDMHSHILPGIDDGASSLEVSLEMIRGMRQLGYKRLIASPHIMWDMYRNTSDIIRQKLDIVREAVQKENIDIVIDAAAEYFLDEHVEQLLERNEPLLTISGNKVLVEFSLAFPPMNIKNILFNMQMLGYDPVIAHPERYVYLQRNKEFYEELRDIGCSFQLNILSLSGHYGKSVTELAHYLLKNDYYSLIGTDLHNPTHLDELASSRLALALKKEVNWEKINNTKL